MNSAPRPDSILSSVADSNGKGNDKNVFERVVNNDLLPSDNGSAPSSASNNKNTAMAEHFNLKPDAVAGSSDANDPSIATAPSLTMQMQNLQNHAQQINPQFPPGNMQSSSALNNGGSANGGTANFTSQESMALAMMLDTQNWTSQQQQRQQGTTQDNSKLAENFHQAVVPGSTPTAASAIAVDVNGGGGGLKDPQDVLFAASAVASSNNSTGNLRSPSNLSDGDQIAINSILEKLVSSKGAINAASKTRTKVFHGNGSFPLNLAVMLESVESMNLSHIISWLPSGQSFVIHEPNEFLQKVLPEFFKSSKSTKIRSFYRKLNRWGFSILRNHHLSKQGVGSMKGVWYHPDFFRSRALKCLKIALETGDTSSFLTATHISSEGGKVMRGEGISFPMLGDHVDAHAGNGGMEGKALDHKRRASSPPSLRNSSITESSELSQSCFDDGQPQKRRSHRESDFSLGHDSTTQNFDDRYLPSQVASLQAAGSLHSQPVNAIGNQGNVNQVISFNAGTTTGAPISDPFTNLANSFNTGAAYPMVAAASNNNFNLSNSFTAGSTGSSMAGNFNLANSFTAGTNLTGMQANAVGFINKQGRRPTDFSNVTPSTFHQSQPIMQSMAALRNNMTGQTMDNSGGRQGVSASWTAGSTFSQHDFKFSTGSFPFTNNSMTHQNGQWQNPPLSNDDSTERTAQCLSARYQGRNHPPQQGRVQGEPGAIMTSEDVELASFFDKFAESIQD